MREKTFEKLYGVASTGKIKTWEIRVEEENDVAKIIILSGYIDGKITPKEKKITEGKNIGKANETTPFTQAVSEAESQWRKKLDQNYDTTIPDVDNYEPNVLKPMLLKKYNEHKDKLKFPCLLSPKLDGINCLCEILDGKVIYHSRGGKEFTTLDHMTKELLETFNVGDIVGGEIYVHGMSLQKIGSYTKKLKEDADLLELWVYDVINDKEYDERYKYVSDRLKGKDLKHIKLTPTFDVHNEEDIEKLYKKLVFKHDFEGVVIRNKFGLYKCGYRSADVLKYKNFLDEEFEIIGGKEGSGQDEGCVIFRCKTKDGNEFDVRPMGSVEQRKEYYTNLKNYVGKFLNVRFRVWSDDGTPLELVGRGIREEFDM